MVQTVWEQTLAEVQSGFLIGPRAGSSAATYSSASVLETNRVPRRDVSMILQDLA